MMRRVKRLISFNCAFVKLVRAAELLEFFEQVVRPESLLRGARGVEDHPALVDHHEAIAKNRT